MEHTSSTLGFRVGRRFFEIKKDGYTVRQLKEIADRFVRIYFKTEIYSIHTQIEWVSKKPIKSRKG